MCTPKLMGQHSQAVHAARSELLLPRGSCDNILLVLSPEVELLCIPRLWAAGLSSRGAAAVAGTAASLPSL